MPLPAGGVSPAGRDVPVMVTIDADEGREVRTRDFAGHRFRSALTRRDGAVWKRFGLTSFRLGLLIPVPRALVPVSDTAETEDADGRFRFDVRVARPGRADCALPRLAGARGVTASVPGRGGLDRRQR